MIPAVLEPMRRIFESTFSGTNAEAGISGARVYVAVLELVVEPASRILRWCIITSCLMVLSRIIQSGERLTLKSTFSFIAYAETIFILERILTVLIIHLRGISTIENEYGLTVFKGAEWFFRENYLPAMVSSFLGKINPFSIWYVVTISLKIDRLKSMGYSLIAWILWIVISLAAPYFGRAVMRQIM
jgi:hypothetical protein